MQIYSITLTKPSQTNRIKKTSSKAIASHLILPKRLKHWFPDLWLKLCGRQRENS